MKASLSLGVALILAVTAPAQWLISEVHTGTPDAVEITNVSGVPLPIAGVGILFGQNSVCPAGALNAGGAYVSTSAVIVPAGATYIFEEFGVAGAPGLTAPLAGLGERTGTGISWANGSWAEVSLYVGNVIVGGGVGVAPNYFDDQGTMVDYVQVAFQQAANVFSIASDNFHLHRGTGPTPTGHWLSGPAIRGPALTDSIYRISLAGALSDTNSNADWNFQAAHTLGLPNPVGGAGVATAGCELNIVHPAVGVPALQIFVTTANPPQPGALYYTLFSLMPEACAGYAPGIFVPGPIFGLANDVWGQLFFPVPSPPFNNFLNAGGSDMFFTGVIPPLAGTALQARTIVIVGGVPALMSDYVYTTL